MKASYFLLCNPLTVKISGIKDEFSDEFERRYSSFLVEGDKYDISVDVLEGNEKFFKKGNGFFGFEEEDEDGKRVVLSYNFKGYDLNESTEGVVFVGKNSQVGSYLSGLENFLRWIFSRRITRLGGFLVHSSGLVKEGKAHLFIGDSSDGKTTVYEFGKKRGFLTLSDDLNVIFQKDGNYFAVAASFYGRLPQNEKPQEKFVVSSIYRLRKASENKLKKLTKAEGYALFLPCCVFIKDINLRNEILSFSVMKFLKDVSSFELFFKKDETFLDLIG